jgi:hypothetical protein
VELNLRARVRAGDREAFGVLFDECARSVYNHAFRLTGNWSTAGEVVSLTFLEGWRLGGTVRPDGGSLRPRGAGYRGQCDRQCAAGVDNPAYAWLRSLPASPQALLRMLRALTRGYPANEQDGQTFDAIGSLLGKSIVPPGTAVVDRAIVNRPGEIPPRG